MGESVDPALRIGHLREQVNPIDEDELWRPSSGTSSIIDLITFLPDNIMRPSCRFCTENLRNLVNALEIRSFPPANNNLSDIKQAT